MQTQRILKLSILTSFASKGAGFLFQIAAIPIALTLLNTEQFALYMIYSGFSVWVGLSATGIAPNLTAKIAAGASDTEVTKYFFNAVVFISTTLFLIGLPLFILGLTFWGQHIFESEITEVLIVYVFVALMILSGIIDSANAGKNQVHVTNLLFSLGSILNLVLMVLLGFLYDQQTSLVVFLASQAGLLVVRFLNILYFFWGHKAIKEGLIVDVILLADYKRSFGAFFFVQLAVVFMQQAVIMFTYTQSKELSALMSVIYRMYGILGSFLTMISQPLWPMIVKIRKTGSLAKLSIWRRKLFIYNLMLAGSLSTFLIIFDGLIVHYWLRSSFDITRTELAIVFFYFGCIAYGQANVAFIMGFEKFVALAKILCAEAGLLILLILALYVADHLTMISIILASIVAFLLTSSWIATGYVSRLLKDDPNAS